MGVGRGATTLPCIKENCCEASKKFSRILWRRPRPKLGCGAKERRRRRRRRRRALSGAQVPRVDPTSQVNISIILLLLIVGN
jgi:hypothetical protein